MTKKVIRVNIFTKHNVKLGPALIVFSIELHARATICQYVISLNGALE